MELYGVAFELFVLVLGVLALMIVKICFDRPGRDRSDRR